MKSQLTRQHKCCRNIKGVIAFLYVSLFATVGTAQTTRYVSTQTELTNAITSSASGDIISFTNNIVVTGQISLTKNLIIQGNNYNISVTVTGLNDQGQFNSSASNFRVFLCNTASTTITINNLTIKGGRLTTSGEHGGAIDVAQATASLTLNNCIISNGVANGSNVGVTNGGGGIRNAGKLFMNNCYLRRNAAHFGGALLNEGTGIAFVEKTTMTENRATSSSGGGGAFENRSGGNIYFNNSTLSNNQSQIVGGAVNNLSSSTLYFINSSATGNVVYGASGSLLVGGALSNNGGAMYIINSLMAHNYRRNAGSETNPTGFILDDITAYSNQAGVNLLYSIYHAALPGGMGTNSNNIQYTGNANGSDNAIFSGGDVSTITDYQGLAIGTASIYRPFLYSEAGSTVGPTLKSGSFIAQSGNQGTATRFANNGGTNVVLSYWNGSSFVAVNGRQVGNASNLVQTDQVGTTRANPPSRGSIEAVVNDLYMVKVNATSNGSATGGTTYGDVYPSGTSITLTAIPNAGYTFTRWDWVLGGTGTASTSNPYTFTVNQNSTLVPVFSAVSVGTYSITYAGNGNTGGIAPATQTFTANTTISNANTLVRKGYAFTGWNTAANGSGTAYATGAIYSAGVNLVLYAQWQEILWIGSVSSEGSAMQNWQPNQVPASGSSFSIAVNAANNLVLPANYDYDEITFRNAGRKIVLENYDLKVTNLTNTNGSNYVRTNGTGRLKMNINSSENKIFPVGNSTYNPVSITNRNAGSDEFSVLVFDEVYTNGTSGTPSSTDHVQRTWDINKTNANTGSGVDFVFNWSNPDVVGSIITPALFHYSNGWSQQTGTTSSEPNTLTYTGYTGTFSPFAIAEANAILPLRWLSFTSQKQQGHVLLNWATAAEQNVKDFLVQHSKNGSSWTTIGSIFAAGNNTAETKYSFVHISPEVGNNYYRLLQRDNDGKQSFSKVVSESYTEAAQSIRILGNPVINGELKVQMPGAATISIFNAAGRLLWQKQLQTGIQVIPVSTLSKGAYYMKSGSQTEGFIIQ